MLATDEKPLLSCNAVSVHFGALAAVDGLSFDVRPGEILGVGGPNGAGKTTLFDVISGFAPASGGRIVLDGHDITRSPPHRVCHRGLSRTFQLNAAYDSLTVRENILCASYYGFKNVIFPRFRFDKATRERADDAIAFVGLEKFSDTIVGILPILQRKLLMLAAAVVRRPKLLMLDEPVGGLNRQETNEITDLIRRFRDEYALTIILIEHVMRFLVGLSDRALIMHHGQKIYEGSASGLSQDRTVIEVYLGERMAERLRSADEMTANNG
jgi:branched-chain amino acid transport system ATP-binding protein